MYRPNEITRVGEGPLQTDPNFQYQRKNRYAGGDVTMSLAFVKILVQNNVLGIVINTCPELKR